MTTARITSVTGDSLLDVRLSVPTTYSFCAGQYLLAGDSAIALSIASAPENLPELRLLFRSDGSAAAEGLRAELTAQTLTISDAAGDVVPNPADDLTFVCAGTGIAQALSVIGSRSWENGAATGLVYWARLGDEPVDASALAGATAFETLDPTLGIDNELQQRLLRDAAEIKRTEVVLCGAPGFVYQCVDTLESAGLSISQMHADVFAYAPRPGAE